MNKKIRPYIGVAVIVVRDGRVLLGKRRNAHGAGTWQFPGGHLEYGESIEACARRELFEETGLSILNLRIGSIHQRRLRRREKALCHAVCGCRPDDRRSPAKKPDKCERWGWYRWSEMPQPHFLPIVNLLKQDFSIAEVHHQREKNG